MPAHVGAVREELPLSQGPDNWVGGMQAQVRRTSRWVASETVGQASTGSSSKDVQQAAAQCSVMASCWLSDTSTRTPACYSTLKKVGQTQRRANCQDNHQIAGKARTLRTCTCHKQVNTWGKQQCDNLEKTEGTWVFEYQTTQAWQRF